MVLGVSNHAPSAGYAQQGYAHDHYGNSSSMQMMRPHSTMHSAGHNHHGNGSYPHNNGHGHGNSSYSSGMHSHHGPGSSGYGNHHNSHMSMGSSRPQDMSYGHQSHGHQSHGHSSSSPYHQQGHNSSHGWISKDLDD